MGRRAADQGIASGLAVMNMNTMNDNVGDELNGNASTISNVDVGAAAIDGLEAVQDEFLSESDDHVMIEDDPEGLWLDGSVAESAGFGVDGVDIWRVSDGVERAVSAADGVAAEADAAIGEFLAVEMPVRVTAPAVVYGVACAAWKVTQWTPCCAVDYAPANINKLVNKLE